MYNGAYNQSITNTLLNHIISKNTIFRTCNNNPRPKIISTQNQKLGIHKLLSSLLKRNKKTIMQPPFFRRPLVTPHRIASGLRRYLADPHPTGKYPTTTPMHAIPSPGFYLKGVARTGVFAVPFMALFLGWPLLARSLSGYSG